MELHVNSYIFMYRHTYEDKVKNHICTSYVNMYADGAPVVYTLIFCMSVDENPDVRTLSYIDCIIAVQVLVSVDRPTLDIPSGPEIA